MADDLLGRVAPVFGGAFSADSALITFGGLGSGGVGLLTQRIQFTYSQRITRVWEIGTNYTFYVAGRAEGQASADRILGPRPVTFLFYLVYGNVCNAAGNSIIFTMQQGCYSPTDPQASANAAAVELRGCVIQSVTWGVQNAEQMVVNESTQLFFVAAVPLYPL